MAVMFLWILATVLALTVAVAFYLMQAARREQVRADVLAQEQQARDNALEHFTMKTLPSVVESVRRADSTGSRIDLPAGVENSRFAQRLWQVAERYTEDLRLVQAEARDIARREAEHDVRQAITTAGETARAEVEGVSREATSAAVRSFGTSVVSLGADVSQVVSAALRRHRDDAVYETLTRIDHSVQQMIRQAQSYVIVCGGLPGRRWPPQALTDLVGGAAGRVRDYLRVRAGQLDRVVIARAVEPLVHTLATLLDNALRYSPPTSFVDVTFQEGHHGVTVIIDDAGVRMNAEQMEEARQVLAGERPVDIHLLGPSPKVGFPGIAALTRRYGFTVYIDGPNIYGGMRAMVYIPETLLVSPDAGGRHAAGGAVPAVESQASHVPQIPQAAAQPAQLPQQAPAMPTGAVEQTELDSASVVYDITSGGLPKRRRRSTMSPQESGVGVVAGPGSSASRAEPARPDIAAAWHSGTKSGRAAASDHIEGMTS